MTVALFNNVDNFIGVSGDVKPTDSGAGSLFYETNTGATYIYDGAAWKLKTSSANLGFLATKTVTFTGAANLGAVGNVPIFTVTGEVLILYLTPTGTVTLTEAAPTATIALGVTGSTSLFIAATTATLITAGKFWTTTTPVANGVALPAALKDIVITDNIVGTVAAQAVNGGAIRWDVYWTPLSSDGLVV